MKAVDISVNEPTFKYRGMYHDDKDLIPRPIDSIGYIAEDPIVAAINKESHIQKLEPGYPEQCGEVGMEWWERFFETALRLRMNQVAPYVREPRSFEVNKMASDWGLFFSSHHYDMLLSNPWGYERFGLAKERGVEGPYNWNTNKEGMIKFWEAGVIENKSLECIWPVGLRGTDDVGMLFPEGTPINEKGKILSDIIETQVALTKEHLPKNADPIFHFTLYHEVQEYYEANQMQIPEDVILVWSDDGDGKMRALPKNIKNNKHGVYYHLAFHGVSEKQTVHTVKPSLIEEQFRKIVKSGATEYMMLNISEQREFVMGTRFIADICWDAKTAFEKPDAANRFVNWWSNEYFGKDAAADAVKTYNNYYDILHSYDQIFQGALALDYALYWQKFRMYGDLFVRNHYNKDWLNTMTKRVAKYDNVFKIANRAMENMDEQEAQFFFENAMYGMLIDYRGSQAALAMNKALYSCWNCRPEEREYAREAMRYLLKLQEETKRMERPPFENWYMDTFMRGRYCLTSVNYTYLRLKEWMNQLGIDYTQTEN
ncbi:glycosyl hydrolase 115 family protein [Formosa agariphila]|nr:glycosyl hydrolase 115 family protein [Formosa agariphila]